MSFILKTCKKCKIEFDGYHNGTNVVVCPECDKAYFVDDSVKTDDNYEYKDLLLLDSEIEENFELYRLLGYEFINKEKYDDNNTIFHFKRPLLFYKSGEVRHLEKEYNELMDSFLGPEVYNVELDEDDIDEIVAPYILIVFGGASVIGSIFFFIDYFAIGLIFALTGIALICFGIKALKTNKRASAKNKNLKKNVLEQNKKIQKRIDEILEELNSISIER